MESPSIMTNHSWLALALGAALAAGVPGQDQAGSPRVSAELAAAREWSWQCDPIRCALRVTNAGRDVHVRAAYSTERSSLFPFEVQREGDEGWEPVQPDADQPTWRPARHITSPVGRELAPGKEFSFEVELWTLEALSRPGPLRLRFALEARPTASEGAAWEKLLTPWLTLEVREHAANAELLLAQDADELRRGYDRLATVLSSTRQTAMNRGPYNPGPAGPTRSERWLRHAPTAEAILEADEVSLHLRSRARLVLAHGLVSRAAHVPDEQVAETLRRANEHLALLELDAQPASGGLEPMRRMLSATVGGRLLGEDQQLAFEQLRAEYPFFGRLWRWELRELLDD